MPTTLMVKKVKNGWEASIYENKIQVTKIEGANQLQVANEGFQYFLKYVDDAIELEKLYNKYGRQLIELIIEEIEKKV